MISGLQHGHGQMPQQVGKPQLRGIGVGKAFHGIAADVQGGIVAFRTRPRPAAVGERRERSRDDDDRGIAATTAGKGDHMIAMRSADFQWLIIAIREDIGEFGAQLEEMPRPGQFQMAARPILHQAIPVRRLQRCQHAGTFGKIDRPPVVGIDQRKIPKLRALIEVRHARHRRLQRDLAQRVQGAEQRHAPRQRIKRVQKFGRNGPVQNPRDEGLQPCLIGLVRIEPAGLLLALARRLQRIGLHPLQKRIVVRLPGAEQRLIEHVFERRRRRAHLAVDDQMRRVEDLPPRHGAGPLAVNFRQRHDPGAGVLAALGVMRCGRRHAVRPFPGARLHHLVKVIDRKRLGGRIAADLVEREQAVVAIERGVLERFGHHRPGELLHLQRKPAHARRAVRRRGRA